LGKEGGEAKVGKPGKGRERGVGKGDKFWPPTFQTKVMPLLLGSVTKLSLVHRL